MRRSALVALAAIVLAAISVASVSTTAAFPSAPATAASDGRLVQEVVHRRHCHRDARRHYHRAIGRSAWHRHVGSNCRVRVLRSHRHVEGCIRIGDVWICFD